MKLTRILASIVTVALLGTLPACVSTSDFDLLRSQVYRQEQERKKQEERIIQLESELARSQPAQANNWAEVNALRGQVAALSGQMDDIRRTQEHGGTVTVESVHAKVQDLDHKTMFMASQLGVVFDEMPVSTQPGPGAGIAKPGPAAGQVMPPVTMTTEQPQSPQIGQQTEASAPASAPQTEEPVPGGAGQDLYQKALENFYAKKYKQAQTMWAEFVKGFPKDSLVPNAIFWQGEAFFQMQDYANAALTYQKVIENHSKSNKYKAALLKQGISFYKLKKDQAGKLVLEDLIKKYPDSAEAKRAQAYIKGGN